MILAEDQITVSGCYSEYVNGKPIHWLVRFYPTDAGRSKSKRPRQKNDCTVRALALVCDLAYDEAYDILAQAGRECSNGFSFRAFVKCQPIIHGFRIEWRSFPAVKGQSRMNPGKFCTQFPTGRWIVRTAGHVFAVVDGVVLDTHSPRPDRCIYGAWEVTK